MKTTPEPGGADPLLDAVLKDDNWQADSAAFKARALSAFHARQRLRRTLRWSGSLLALTVAFIWALHSVHHSPGPSRTTHHASRATPSLPHTLTDDQLLSLFPSGSCILAVIDGRKELVFLDPDLERVYVASPK